MRPIWWLLAGALSVGGSACDDKDEDEGEEGAFTLPGGGGVGLEGYLYLHERSGMDECSVWWRVNGAPSSTVCLYCDFVLDWAYDVSYTYAPERNELDGTCRWQSEVGYLATYGGELALSLEWYGDVWAFTSDWYYDLPEGYDGVFMLAYDYGGLLYPYMMAFGRYAGGSVSWDSAYLYQYLDWYYGYYYYGDYGTAGEGTLR